MSRLRFVLVMPMLQGFLPGVYVNAQNAARSSVAGEVWLGGYEIKRDYFELPGSAGPAKAGAAAK